VDLKKCSRCKLSKDEVLFRVKFNNLNKKGNTDRLNPQCYQCELEVREESKLKNPTYAFERRLLRRFGITLIQYNEMLKEQNNLCAICKKTFEERGKPCVDHCHTFGTIRGIICDNCNIGIAKFADNIEFLKQAIVYLEVAQGKRSLYDMFHALTFDREAGVR